MCFGFLLNEVLIGFCCNVIMMIVMILMIVILVGLFGGGMLVVWLVDSFWVIYFDWVEF